MNKLPHKKSRGPRGYGNRPYNTKKPKDLFLIVCEGETTEPNYFRSFPLPRRLDIKEFKVVGLGTNTLDLVKQTIEQKQHNHLLGVTEQTADRYQAR